jgi:hypothetical protein
VTASRLTFNSKPLLWAVLAIPALPMLWAALQPDVVFEELLHPSGEWSARLLIVALMLTPLAQLFPRQAWAKRLIRHRRAFGVAAFGYAVLHLAFYILEMRTVRDMLARLRADTAACTDQQRCRDARPQGRLETPAKARLPGGPSDARSLGVRARQFSGGTHQLRAARAFAGLASRPARAPRHATPNGDRTMIARLVLAATALAVASPALATGKMTCNAGPQNTWKSQEALKASLVKQGWQVRKSKVDGGCYEVYGTDEKGNRVEAYFHPVTFEKLLVSRRGKVLFKKQ